MNPTDQGKAQAQAKVERLVAEALKAGGYEDEVPGVCDGSMDWPVDPGRREPQRIRNMLQPELQRACNQLMSARMDRTSPPAPGGFVIAEAARGFIEEFARLSYAPSLFPVLTEMKWWENRWWGRLWQRLRSRSSG